MDENFNPIGPRKRRPVSPKSETSFDIGRVHAYLRGRVWHLRYHERGLRQQRRASPNKDDVRKLAAEIDAQLECGIPSAYRFEQITDAR